jgi:predicted Zn-dependent peptidase
MTTINPLRPTATAPRPYAFPDFERRELSSGMPVWLVPLPDRSLVNVHLLVDAGAASEDEAHAGVAALTAQLLVTGTGRLDAAAFAEATERLGIEVSSESSWDSARAAFQALPEHVDEGLALLAEMVREPRLDPDEFARLKDERLADILQARADPGRLADEMFLRTLYAEGVPYGRISAGSPESVEPLTVDDVRTFQAAAWGSRTANLIVAGGFDAERVMAAAEAAFGGWGGNASPHREIEVRPAGARRVVLVDRPGSVQSELRVGQIGIHRGHPDYFPALVMATLLGGVFGSRLNIRLREELGFTYGAHASFDPRRSAGPLIARAAVETDVTAASIRELLGQLDRMRDEAPTDDELGEVKNFMIGVFPLRFESTGGVAAAIEPLAVYGLPDDFWQGYRDRLEAVTPIDVQRVARELIDPDSLVILLTGDASVVRASVEAEAFGTLEVVPAPA